MGKTLLRFTPPTGKLNKNRKGILRLLALTLMCLATNVGMADTYTFEPSRYTLEDLRSLLSNPATVDGNITGELTIGDKYISISMNPCQPQGDNAQNSTGVHRGSTVKTESNRPITVRTKWQYNGQNFIYITNVQVILASGTGSETLASDQQTYTYTPTSQVEISRIVVTYNYNSRYQITDPEVPRVEYTCVPSDADREKNITYTENSTYQGDMLMITMSPKTAGTTVEQGAWSDPKYFDIYYTTDGTSPKKLDSFYRPTTNKYTGVLHVTQTMNIRMAVWDWRKQKWSEDERSLNLSFNFGHMKAFEDGMEIKLGERYSITDGNRTYISTTYGSKGDKYKDSKGTIKEIWQNASYDEGMTDSEIEGFLYSARGNKDAMGENKWVYASGTAEGHYSEYQNKYDGEKFNPELGPAETLNTFDVPMQGSYIKFEPEVDGQLNIIVRQTGIIGTNAGSDTSSELQKVVKRYTFVCDETGRPIKNLTAMMNSSAKLEARALGWTRNQSSSDFYLKDDIEVKDEGITLKLADSMQKLKDYQIALYQAHYDANLAGWNYSTYPDYRYMTEETLDKKASDYWEELKSEWVIVTSGGAKVRVRQDKAGSADLMDSNIQTNLPNVLHKDTYGWYTIGKAYVRYSIPMKAGKTYFMMGRWTKMAPAGYSFKRDIKDDNEWDRTMQQRAVSIDGITKYNEQSTIEGYENQYGRDFELPDPYRDESEDDYIENDLHTQRITLHRNFDANAWTSLVLPFSMSPKFVEDNFGKDTQIVHFNRVDEHADGTNTLYLTKHYHQMIVAGTPVLIKPTLNINGSTYKTISSISVNTPYSPENPIWDMDANPNNDWCITGSYTPTELPEGAYILGYKKDNNGNVTNNGLVRITQNNTPVAGTRAWIVNKENPKSQLAPAFVINGVEDTTTTIDDLFFGEDATVKGKELKGVYNLNGQLVRTNTTDTTGLPAGIYIAGGKKIVVK